jgi:membrane-associated phospholipid phosphatase
LTTKQNPDNQIGRTDRLRKFNAQLKAAENDLYSIWYSICTLNCHFKGRFIDAEGKSASLNQIHFYLFLLGFIFTSTHLMAADVDRGPDPPASIYVVQPWLDGSLIGLGAALSLYAYSDSGNLIHRRCPCDANEVNSLDRTAIGNKNDFLDRTSDISAAVAVIFPVALDWYDVGFSKQMAEDMTVYAESLSLNSGLVTLAKYAVQRPLPRTYDGDRDLIDHPGGYRSFYSGHTSTTFAALSTAAMTHTLRHPGELWPWYLTALFGTSVAYERVQAGRHFPSDVLMGAAAGTAVGIATPYFHRKPGLANPSFAILPLDDGLYANWKMVF